MGFFVGLAAAIIAATAYGSLFFGASSSMFTPSSVFVASAGGLLTRYLEIGGTDETVDAASNSAIVITNHLTMEMWVRGAANGTGTIQFIMAKGDGAGADTRAYEFLKPTLASGHGDKLMTYVNATGDGLNRKGFRTTSVVWDNNWHHVVAAWNNTVGWKFWIDGVSDTAVDFDSAGTVNSINGSTDPIVFGNRGTGSFYATVDIAHFTLWDTAIFTQNDVDDMYNSGDGADPTMVTTDGAVLKEWWRFGNDPADTITTIQGQVNNIDLTGHNLDSGDIKNYP